MKSYSEQMEEQLEPRSTVARSEFFPEPTAHEVWVRDRIPRGAHYDVADDGPETDAIFHQWLGNIVWKVELASLEETWLNSHSHDFGGFDFDILSHGRE